MEFCGGVNLGETKKSSTVSNVEKDSQIKAGETSFEVNNAAETSGLAVFRDDKLVGELNGIETICHLILTNNLKTCVISFPDPRIENNTIDLYLYQQNPTKVNVSIVNGSPSISTSFSLNARILSIEEDSAYTEEERITQIQEAANDYMKRTSSCISL